MAEDSDKKVKITGSVKDDVNTIYDGLHVASKHAECILFFLEKSVLSKFRFFKKIIMRFKSICGCQKGLEKECGELINKGG